MAKHSIVIKIADGSTNQFSISFTGGFMSRDHVTARVDNEVDGTGKPSYRTITWVTDGIVRIGGDLPTNGQMVEFRRTTPITLAVNDFQNGAVLLDEALDNGFDQCIKRLQEIADVSEELKFAQDVSDFVSSTAAQVEVQANAASDALDSINSAIAELELHPLKGTLTMSYDPGTLTAHPGALLYDENEARAWRFYSESRSHSPSPGMSVYGEYSDDAGATWRGKRTVWPGDPDHAVLDTCALYLNGGMILIVSTEDTNNVRNLYCLRSVNGSTWSETLIAKPAGVEPFLYGTLHPRPSYAGGSQNGAIFYTYTNGSVHAFFTNDGGNAWSTQVVLNGSTEYIDELGATRTGIAWGETAVAQVEGEAKFVLYQRPINTEFLMCATSTDMLNWVNVHTTELINEGPSLEVGTPPHLIEYKGAITLYTFGRENWVDYDTTREQAVLFNTMRASDLYDNRGDFSNITPQVAARVPARAVGMMSHTYLAGGLLAMFRAGESVFSDHDNAATSQIYQMSSQLLPSNPVIHRENLADNPSLDLWSRGTLFSGITQDGTPVAERIQLYCSEAGGGDTMSAARVPVDKSVAANVPHSPHNGMLLTSTGSAYSGFQQVFVGQDAVSKFADTELTVSFMGVGELGAGIRLSVTLDYGSGGSTDETVVAGIATGRSGAGKWSMSSGTVTAPSLVGKVVTSTPRVIIRIDKSSTTPWNYLLCGLKIEFGNGATVMLSPNVTLERQKALSYFQPLSASHMVHRDSATTSFGAINHTPMVRLPTLAGINLSGGFTIRAPNSQYAPVTGITLVNQNMAGGRLVFTHAEDTFVIGSTYRSVAGASLYLEAEL